MFENTVESGAQTFAPTQQFSGADVIAPKDHSLSIVQGQQQEASNQSTAGLPRLELVDDTKLELLAEAISKTCRGIGTDEMGLFELLKKIPRDQLGALSDIYQRKFGITLDGQLVAELSGSELERGRSLIQPHGYDDAARLKVALMEHGQTFMGRSAATCERDIRDTLSTMNEAQIKELDNQYKERYGVSLKDALITNSRLSSATKQSIEIYFKGADKRTTEDTLNLAGIALSARNLDMFEETFRHASPEARGQFKDKGGFDNIGKAFSGLDQNKAKEFATRGDVGLATRVRDNTRWNGDNEEAIEKELSKLSQTDRDSYMLGKKLVAEQRDSSNFTENEKEALEYYSDVRAALEKAAGKWFSRESQRTEMARWEDMIANPGGSFVTELSRHAGSLWDDSVGDVITTVENMSGQDWKRLQEDPEYRRQVDAVLEGFLGKDELKRVKAVLDEKLSLPSYEESRVYGRRNVVDALKDATGILGLDGEKVIDALSRMKPHEQKMYREPNSYIRREIEFAVSHLNRAEQAAARRILEKIDRAEMPTQDIITKLNLQAAKFNTDENQVIRDLIDAFKNDEQLRERILNPTNDADRKFSTDFNAAVHRALDKKEYEKYAKPLIETGSLPFKTMLEINKGFFDDDEYGVYEAVERGSEDDWKELLEDPAGTLPFLSKEEREIALNIARQKGEMRPEDELRAAMLGAGTDEQKIKDVFSRLDPDAIQIVKDEYERKYRSNLDGDLFAELGGSDKSEVARQTRETPATSREAYNNLRDDVYESMDGAGRAWVRNFWDGTADTTNFELHQISAAMTQWARDYQEMPVAERRFYETRAYEALEQYRRSEEAAADLTVDAAIIAGGLLAAKFTGGVSLGLLAKTAVIGAAFKVGTKAAVMGADYDFQSAQTIIDGATGAVDALSVVVGPRQVAQWMGMGMKTSVQATNAMFAEGAQQLLKEGVTSSQVGQRLFELIAKSMAQGSNSIDAKVVAKLAQELGKEGSEKALQAMISRHLQAAVISQSTTFLQGALREAALNAGAAAIGGGSSGTVRGLARWDSSKTFEDNMAMVAESAALSAGTAAAIAGSFTLTFKAIGKAIDTVKTMTGNGPYLERGTEALVNGQPIEANTMVTVGRQDIAGATDAISPKHASIARDARGNLLLMDHSETGTWIKRAGSDTYEKVAFASPTRIFPGDEVRLGSADGPNLKLKKVASIELNPFRAPRSGEVHSLATSAGGTQFKRGKIDVNQDMTHVIDKVKHEMVEFDELLPGAEKHTYKDYADFHQRALKQVDRHSRIYKLKGFNTEIVIPEDYAQKLDRVRDLRQLAALDPKMFPAEAAEIRAAQLELSKHPMRNRLLPEQMAMVLQELPDRRTITRIELWEGASPEDLWNSQSYKPNFEAAADAARGKVRFFKGTNDVTRGVREILSHEWAHTIESHPGLRSAFDTAAEIEKGGWYAREYARRNIHENWAVHLGEELLHSDKDHVHTLIKQSPLRTVAMAEALRRTLESVPADLQSPYHQQLLERLQLIGTEAVPEARKLLDTMLKSGDATQIQQALDFMQNLQRGRQGYAFGPSIMDFNSVINLARTSPNLDAASKAIHTLIELYDGNPPEHIVEMLKQMSKGTDARAHHAAVGLTAIKSVPVHMHLINSTAVNPADIIHSIYMFDSPADKMRLFRAGLDRLSANERVFLVDKVIAGPQSWQMDVINELAKRGDASFVPSLRNYVATGKGSADILKRAQEVIAQLENGSSAGS